AVLGPRTDAEDLGVGEFLECGLRESSCGSHLWKSGGLAEKAPIPANAQATGRGRPASTVVTTSLTAGRLQVFRVGKAQTLTRGRAATRKRAPLVAAAPAAHPKQNRCAREVRRAGELSAGGIRRATPAVPWRPQGPGS